MLDLVIVEGEGLQLPTGQEIKGDRFVLKPLCPNFSDLTDTAIHIAHFIMHLEAVNLEGGISQEVLDEV